MAQSAHLHEVFSTLLHGGVSDSVREEGICEEAPVANLVLDPDRMLACTAATAGASPSRVPRLIATACADKSALLLTAEGLPHRGRNWPQT